MKTVINMKVIKITPQGYCNGVKQALQKCVDALNDPTIKRPIYLLGMIIHNKHVCAELEEKGIIILEGENKSALVDEINEGTIIITAHGVENNLKEKIINKGLNLIDATCKIVERVHINIATYLKNGYEIIYLGKNHHPETIGIMNESDKIHLIEKSEELELLDKNKKYYVTNQTTLSHYDILEIHQTIKENFPNVLVENTVCLATTKRESALINIETDLLVVVGDTKSSNTKKLFVTAVEKSKAHQVVFVENAKELLNYIYDDYKIAHVTSGASTPEQITNQVVRFLESDLKDLSILEEKLTLIS